MIFTEVIPEAYEAHSSKSFVGATVIVSWLSMSYFQSCLEAALHIGR